MTEPSDEPFPQSVYWRRRMWAAGAAVVFLILGAWAVGMLARGADQHAGARGAGDQKAVGAASPLSSRSSASPSNPPPPSAVPVVASSTSSESPPPPPPPPPGPPQPCPDDVTKVSAEPDRQAYAVGQRPAFRLVVSNGGQVACTRDIGRQLRELVVTAADGARLWSTNDCYFHHPSGEVHTLQPGERQEFSVTWAGRTSEPGCPRKRDSVQPGGYLLIAKLGALTSPPAPFTIGQP